MNIKEALYMIMTSPAMGGIGTLPAVFVNIRLEHTIHASICSPNCGQ